MGPVTRQARLETRIKVNLKYPDRKAFVERFAQNISKTGIFIRTSDPAPVGARVHFEYALADGTRVLRGVGLVRWARKPAEAAEPDRPPGMGVEFIDLDPQSEQLITQIVAEHGDGARAPQRRPQKPVTAPVAATNPAVAGPLLDLDPEEADALDTLLGAKPVSAAKAPTPASSPAPASPQAAASAALRADAELDLLLDLEDKAPPATAAKNEVDLDVAPEELRTSSPAAAADALVDVEVEVEPKMPAPATAPEVETTVEPTVDATPALTAEQVLEPGIEAALEAAAEPAIQTEEEPVSSAPSPIAGPTLEHVILDLSRPALHLGLVDGARAVTTRAVPLCLAMDEGALRLADQGLMLSGLPQWAGRGWPSPYVAAIARRLQLDVSGTGNNLVIEIGGNPIDALDLLAAAIREAFEPYAGAPPSSATLVLPPHASPALAPTVTNILSSLGVDAVETVSQAAALFASVDVALTPADFGLTVQVGPADAQVALVKGPATVVGTRFRPDASLTDADLLLTDRAAVNLLREKGVDVAEAPPLYQALLEQIHAARVGAAVGAEWTVLAGGGEITVDALTVAAWCAELSERLVLAADELLQEHQVPAAGLKAVILLAEERPWPGLAEALEAAFGLTPMAPGRDPASIAHELGA
ncbi:MAG: TIGR02266 family protein [Deltaproteobacteria bacterium]|nr:TIGR02266 family protein [Deltaproteobacteria bacterium]